MTDIQEKESHQIQKRSVLVAGHRTSVSLEAAFWIALRDTAENEGKSLNQLVTEIDAHRKGNLSSALRLYVLKKLKSATR